MQRPATGGIGTELSDRAERPAALSDRQRQVVELVTAYVSVAQEPPSMAWLARRMSISRERARQHLERLREKRVF